MARHKIKLITTEHEIDLWGKPYKVNRLTKDRQEDLDELLEAQRDQIIALAEEQGHIDDAGKPILDLVRVPASVQVDRVCAQWEILLSPVEDSDDVDTYVREMWDTLQIAYVDVEEVEMRIAKLIARPR